MTAIKQNAIHNAPSGGRASRLISESEVLSILGDFDRSPGAARGRAARAARQRWQGLTPSEQDRWIRMLSPTWNRWFLQGEYHRVARVGRQLRAMGRRSGRSAIEAEGTLALGMAAYGRGDWDVVMSRLKLAEAIYASLDSHGTDAVRAAIPLGIAARLSGDHVTAQSVLRGAHRTCQELEEPGLLSSVSQALGVLALVRGDLDQAENSFRYVVGAATALGNPRRRVRGMLGAAQTAVRRGRAREALAHAERSAKLAGELRLERERALAWEYRGDALVLDGRPDEALVAYRRALGHARHAGGGDMRIELHRKLAEMWFDLGQTRYAGLHVERAVEREGECAEREDLLALHRLSVCLDRSPSGEDGITQALEAHLRAARTNGFGFEALCTLRELARFAEYRGDPASALAWWNQLEITAEVCGASDLAARWRLGSTARSGEPGSADRNRLATELPQVDLERHGIVTSSREIQEQAALLARLAPSRVPILIMGESGTGKELFARLAHDLSPRTERPYVAVNCGALPGDLLESELFGYVRGAFTGAMTDKPGLFRSASGGTVFLDEIGEMSPRAQAKLLRFLESGEVRGVGDTRTEKVDVRIIAATNVDLQEAMERGRFRRDLYYRLNGLALSLPPLRLRMGDVALLAVHFTSEIAAREGKRLSIDPDTTRWLMSREWGGNVRELRLSVERAVGLAPPHGRLLRHHFAGFGEGPVPKSLPAELEEIERARLRCALDATGWNKSAAATLVGMSRTTFTGRVKRLGVERPA